MSSCVTTIGRVSRFSRAAAAWTALTQWRSMADGASRCEQTVVEGKGRVWGRGRLRTWAEGSVDCGGFVAKGGQLLAVGAFHHSAWQHLGVRVQGWKFACSGSNSIRVSTQSKRVGQLSAATSRSVRHHAFVVTQLNASEPTAPRLLASNTPNSVWRHRPPSRRITLSSPPAASQPKSPSPGPNTASCQTM
jgi:hypothetical protein